MNLQELMTQIAKRSIPQADTLEAKGNPEDQYRDLLEREFLIKGKILLKRYADLQERVGQLQLEQEVIRGQLFDFETSARQTLDLSTGDQMTVDLGTRPSVRAFFQGVREVLGGHSTPGTKDLPMNGDMYDKKFLMEESDDLLHYL